jgi:hypothetical protein
MEVLLGLHADILCEGHLGVLRPETEVERYIQNYLKGYRENKKDKTSKKAKAGGTTKNKK